MKSPLNHHHLLDSNIKFYKRNMHEKKEGTSIFNLIPSRMLPCNTLLARTGLDVLRLIDQAKRAVSAL